MDRVSITESEILAALREAANARPDVDGAFTVEELKEVMGRGEKYIRALLRPLVKSGVVEAVQRPDVDLCNRPCKRHAYRVKAA